MKKYSVVHSLTMSIAAGALFASCSSAKTQPTEDNNKNSPNFIILFADDLGYGDLACYGHPTIKTPNLDKMASEGIRLTSFYVAAPSCTPSRASLLTGRLPMRTGLPRVIGPESSIGLPASEITIAEALKEKQYATMCIGKWHLGDQEKFNPIHNGFDEYYGLLYSNDMQRPWVNTDKPLALYHNTEAIEHPVIQQTLTKRYTEWGTKFIRTHADKPFFLYLAYSMPHVPIFASDEFKGHSRAGKYGDVIEEIDWSVGQILTTLKELGLDERTMVVFSSDNGPWQEMPDRMFGNDSVQPWDCGNTAGLRGYKHLTFDGGQRVPGIFRWPGTIPAGQVSADMASTLDIFPTILSLADISIPEDRVIDGVNIIDFLEGKTPSPVHQFYFYRHEMLQAYRKDSWKLRYLPDEKKPEKSTIQLFNMDSDPYEMYNRANEFPEKVEEMTRIMSDFDEQLRESLQ